MSSASVPRLLDFSQVFEIACDSFGFGIGGVLSQEGYPIAFFSEKLNDSRRVKYTTFEKSYMPYSNPFAIEDITFYLKSLIYILTMKLLSIGILRLVLT